MKNVKERFRDQKRIKTMHRRMNVVRRMPAPEFQDPQGVTPFLDLQPGNLKELAMALGGDEKLARRIIELTNIYPMASLPELIVYDWLERNDYQFVYQGQYGGGRQMRGGAVPDFVVEWGGYGLILRVQGEYWHNLPGQAEKDIVQRMQMMGQYINGLQVKAIVDIWERDIYQRRDFTMQMAVAGVGIRE